MSFAQDFFPQVQATFYQEPTVMTMPARAILYYHCIALEFCSQVNCNIELNSFFYTFDKLIILTVYFHVKVRLYVVEFLFVQVKSSTFEQFLYLTDFLKTFYQ